MDYFWGAMKNPLGTNLLSKRDEVFGSVPPVGSQFLITEAGDLYITESGDNLITDD